MLAQAAGFRFLTIQTCYPGHEQLWGCCYHFRAGSDWLACQNLCYIQVLFNSNASCSLPKCVIINPALATKIS